MSPFYDNTRFCSLTSCIYSARYYHRHPYAKSASTSPVKRFGSLNFSADRARVQTQLRRSPSGHLGDTERDESDTSPPSGFATVGGLLAKRNFTLPFPADRRDAEREDQGAHAATQGAGISAPHLVPDINANGRLVILTPTTQEWRELGLDSLKHLGGEGVGSESDSERGQDWNRRDSEASSFTGSLDHPHATGLECRRSSLGNDNQSGSEPNSRRASIISPLLTGALNRRRHESNDNVMISSDARRRVRSDTVHSVDNLVSEDTGVKDYSAPAVPLASQDLMIEIPSRSSGTTSFIDMNGNEAIGSETRSSDVRLAPSLRSAPPLLEETDVFAKLLSEQMAHQQKRSPSPGIAAVTGQHDAHEGANASSETMAVNDGLGNQGTAFTDASALRLPKTFEPASTLSRSQSMREPPTAPPHMTKREKERERLFRMVGEEIERSGLTEGQVGSRGIKQIGKGLTLGLSSSAKQGQANPIIRTESGPATFGPTLAPTQKVNAADTLGKSNAPVLSPMPHRLQDVLHSGHSPLISEVHVDTISSPVNDEQKSGLTSGLDASSKPRSRAHSRAPSLAQLSSSAASRTEKSVASETNSNGSTPLPPLTSRRRQSQRLSLLAGRTPLPHQFPAVLPPSAPTGNNGPRKPSAGLSAFSAFATMTPSSPPVRRLPLSKDVSSVGIGSLTAIPGHLQQSGRSDSALSLAPSTVAPSECGTPVGETAGGLGGGGIDDYVIQSEAGKGAYGLVRRAKRKGPDGQPIGVSVSSLGPMSR